MGSVLSTLVSGLDRKGKQDSHWGKLDVLNTLVPSLCTVRKRWAVIEGKRGCPGVVRTLVPSLHSKEKVASH